MDALWSLVKEIPYGRCTSYGALGRALEHPTTGRIVGRLMANCPSDIPWWRVVNRMGDLAINKRDPMLAAAQKQRLVEEGVQFEGDRVKLEACYWEPFL